MMNLCLTCSPGFAFHDICKDVKGYQPCDRIPPSFSSLTGYEDPWSPINGFSKSHQIINLNSTLRKPFLIGIQESPVILSSLLSGQCAELEGHEEEEMRKLYFPSLLDLTEFQELTLHGHQKPYCPSLMYFSNELGAMNPPLDVSEFIDSLKIKFHLEEEVSVNGSRTEIKGILAFLRNFYLPTSSPKSRKQSLIPHFSRLDTIVSQASCIHSSSLNLGAVAAPLKSPRKWKQKQTSRKRNSRKTGTERHINKRNYSHAGESLLSLMIDKNKNGRTSIRPLKESGPELPELLNQLTANIAGVGLSVGLFVICKVTSGRAALSASKIVTIGIGFGLIWLAGAVYRLRETTTHIIMKKTKKRGLREEDMINKVDTCLNEIYLRGATVLVLAMLRFTCILVS